MGRISSDLLKRPLQQLAACISFHKQHVLQHFCSGMHRNKKFPDFWTRKWPTSLGFLRFKFFFMRLSFLSFPHLSAAVIDLLLGLLPVKKNSEKASSIQANFTMEWPCVVAGNFALSFSVKFFSIFLHISGSTEPVTLIWVSLERCFPPAELKYRPTLIMAGYGRHGSQRV